MSIKPYSKYFTHHSEHIETSLTYMLHVWPDTWHMDNGASYLDPDVMSVTANRAEVILQKAGNLQLITF